MNEFLSMGGYGGYVWSAFGISIVVLLLNQWWATQRLRRVKAELARDKAVTEAPRKPVVREIKNA